MKKINLFIILMLMVVGISLEAAVVIDYQVDYRVVPTINNIPIATINNISNLINSTSYTPYSIPFATSNNIVLTNGNFQFYAPTNTTTIYMPNADTNQAHSVRIDIYQLSNYFSISSNNVYFGTNEVLGVNADSVSIRTNGTTSLLFDKAVYNPNWRVFKL